MGDEIVASEGRGKWHGVRDELTGNVCITNPAGTKYEISAPRLAQLDRSVTTLLNDMLDGLIDLQNENEALRARDALRDRAEGQAAFDVVAQLEAAKAERAADKAGFEAVIRELYGERYTTTDGDRLFPWNPLADDGDAFRLETDLSFSAIEWAGGIEVGEYEISDGKLRPVAGRTAYVKFDDHAGDKREARRLAGLRAAAEIGMAMK